MVTLSATTTTASFGFVGVGRAVKDGDRDLSRVRLADDGNGARAVLRDDDDAVYTLRDAVTNLLELSVGVLVSVAFDDLGSALSKRLCHGPVPSNPKFSF
jgi:hypothetical protein